jgi:hypothetical protein
MTVSLFEPQNQVGYGLSVVAQNLWEDLAARFAWKRWLGFLSLASRLADGACGIIVEAAWR